MLNSSRLSTSTLRLVLVVSCAHALVHVYELGLPSVEQYIAEDYGVSKKVMGLLANCWRLPFGLGALLAGWLVDRVGASKMLAWYLLGCGLTCIVAGSAFDLPVLFTAMFVMGSFAAIYHPAGLALISHETNPVNRPKALGIHGVFGSAGIAAAPFIAALVLSADLRWTTFYWLLAAPGLLLGLYFALRSRTSSKKPPKASDQAAKFDEQADWRSFFTLTIFAMMQGFLYAAVLSFLPRYLSGWRIETTGAHAQQFHDALSRFAAAAVLAVGCAGQFLAGWFARPNKLELQLTAISLLNAPFLVWMAFAEGWSMPVAGGLWALVHFMHQPIYNSLIAKYTPRSRRSLSYGFSFAMAFGVGSLGASFAGWMDTFHQTYLVLAAISITAGCLGMLLWSWNRQQSSETTS